MFTYKASYFSIAIILAIWVLAGFVAGSPVLGLGPSINHGELVHLEVCRNAEEPARPLVPLTAGMTATLLPPRYWKVCFYLKPGGFVLVPHLCIFLTGLFCTFGTHFVILLNCFRGKFSSRYLTCGSTFSLSFSAEAIVFADFSRGSHEDGGF